MELNTNLILRVRGPHGMTRITVDPTDTCGSLYRKVDLIRIISKYIYLRNNYKIENQCKILIEDDWSISLDKAYCAFIPRSEKLLTNYNFKNGDLIYIKCNLKETTTNNQSSVIIEDEIDKIIEKKPGLVYRGRSQQCNHNANSQCISCIPYQIFDQSYLDSLNPPLKHISLHVYIRRILDTTKNKNAPIFDEIRCKIKPGCSNHPSWPMGICTQCQPSSIALTRQEFRNIDNIMLDCHGLVDSFIGYWRKSRQQRIGYLYGTYEDMENIPLGIRAHVFSIYEPPQISTFDSIQLQPDPKQSEIDEVAKLRGYRKIGWIITDLLISNIEKGKMMQTRSVSTYLLSAQECITAAHYQNVYPNICKYSTTGLYGSKFVTVVVTSNEVGEIEFYGWQVSNQCMALVKDDCLIPTIDEPSLAYVRDQSAQQFIPDVYYKDVDEFKNNINKPARPVPVDYFLVEVPTGFPVNDGSKIDDNLKNKQIFPNFNRESIGEYFNLSFIKDQLKKMDSIILLSNFNILCYIYPLLIEGLKSTFRNLCFHLRENSSCKELIKYCSTKEFKEMIAFINTYIEEASSTSSIQTNYFSNTDIFKNKTNYPSSSPPPPPPSLQTPTSNQDLDNVVEVLSSQNSSILSPDSPHQFNQWQCSTCTYINTSPQYDNDGGLCCEMCGLPKVDM